MKNVLRSATVYAAQLPAHPEDMRQAIQSAEHLIHEPPTASMLSSAGFWRIPTTQEFVSELPGVGYALCVRHDEKIIPSSVVARLVDEQVRQIEEAHARRVYRKERLQIKDEVMQDLAVRAEYKTSLIFAFYDAKAQNLVVASASAKAGHLVASLLVKALGSLKTTTIHIDGLKHGLTTRLQKFLEDDLQFHADVDDLIDEIEKGGPFGKLEAGEPKLVLKDPDGAKAAFQGIEGVHTEVLNLIGTGYQVEEIELRLDETTFRLTNDFVFKGIKFPDPEIDDGEDDPAFLWRATHAGNLLDLTRIVDELCRLMGHPNEPIDADAEDLTA